MKKDLHYNIRKLNHYFLQTLNLSNIQAYKILSEKVEYTKLCKDVSKGIQFQLLKIRARVLPLRNIQPGVILLLERPLLKTSTIMKRIVSGSNETFERS